jgi:hypothetical protein
MRGGRCLWCWISVSLMTATGVVLTLVLTDIYIALMILIGHLMRLLLTRSESIELTTAITLLTPYHLLLLVRLGDYTVNLSDYYSYRLIEKLAAFLQLQEFSLRNLTGDTSSSAARRSLPCLNRVWATFSPWLQLYVLRLT